jgi:hypothetical protein
MAIIEHELVQGGGDEGDEQYGDWQARHDAQGAKAARHIKNARDMLENRRHGFALLGATPEGQFLLALETMLAMVYTPEEQHP